jgi:hypothetical protein
MSQKHDDRHYHDLTPDAMREQFGDDVTAGLEFTQPGPAAKNSSAMKHVRLRDRDAREAQLEAQQRNRDLLRDKEKDRAAYQLVIVDGHEGTSQDQARADRYAREHNLLPRRSSAEILAGQRS